MAFFISDQDSKKERINIINGIHKIKGKTSVNIVVSLYTNKHITYNKREYVGHLELTIEEILQDTQNPGATTSHSITNEKSDSREKVVLDTFKPPCHKLKENTETKLTDLQKEYDSQFAQDETFIGSTSLTEMTIDTGTSEPVSHKACSIVMKHYQWVKN